MTKDLRNPLLPGKEPALPATKDDNAQQGVQGGNRLKTLLEASTAALRTAGGVLRDGRAFSAAESTAREARLAPLRSEFIPLLKQSESAQAVLNKADEAIVAIDSGKEAKRIQGKIDEFDQKIPQLQSQLTKLHAKKEPDAAAIELRDRTKVALGVAQQKRAELQKELTELPVQRQKLQTVKDTKLIPVINAPKDSKYQELMEKEVAPLDKLKNHILPIIEAVVEEAEEWFKDRKGVKFGPISRKFNAVFQESSPVSRFITRDDEGTLAVTPGIAESLSKYQQVRSLNRLGEKLTQVIARANDVNRKFNGIARYTAGKILDAFLAQTVQPGQMLRNVRDEKGRLIGAVLLEAGGGIVDQFVLDKREDEQLLKDIVEKRARGFLRAPAKKVEGEEAKGEGKER